MSVPSSEAADKLPQRSFWIAVICGAVILTIGIGARQSFGIFQTPTAADLNVRAAGIVHGRLMGLTARSTRQRSKPAPRIKTFISMTCGGRQPPGSMSLGCRSA
jgi:hypothetical protein